LNYPPADVAVETDTVFVTGLVTGNVEVARIQMLVNGREVSQPRDFTLAGKGYPFRIAAPLVPGPNVIEVTAGDKAGNAAQVVRTISRVIPASPAPPVPKVADRWAVVIGIGEYDDPQIPRLRYATPDA